MDLSIKIVILVGLLGLLFVFVQIAKTGRRARKGNSHLPHSRWTDWAVILTALLVLIIEIAVRLGTTTPRGTLFDVHLAFAVPFLIILLVTRYWFTGLKIRSWHRFLGYLCLFLFAGTFITGVWLIA